MRFVPGVNNQKPSSDCEEINNVFISTIKNINIPNKGTLFDLLIPKVGEILKEIKGSSQITKEIYENFIKNDSAYQNFLSLHKDLSPSGSNEEIHLGLNIENYNPYKKSTDFVVTIALLKLVSENKNIIEDKEMKAGLIEKDGYKIEMLSKNNLASGFPMVLGGITNCCLNLGATGGHYSLASIFDPSYNFAVVKNPNGKIVAHALVWMSDNGKSIVIDSIDPVNIYCLSEGKWIVDKKFPEENKEKVIELFNDFAQELLNKNKNVESIKMSMGGNTLAALSETNKSFGKKAFGPFKKDTDNEKIYYAICEDSKKYGPLIFKNGEIELLDTANNILPTPEYWVEIDNSGAPKTQIASKIPEFPSITIHEPAAINLNDLKLLENDLKISSIKIKAAKKKIVPILLKKAEGKLFENQNINDMGLYLSIANTTKALVNNGKVKWSNLVKQSLPKNCEKYFMHHPKIHGTTFLHQVEMAKKVNNPVQSNNM